MKKHASLPAAHLAALFSIMVWGTTFIASKFLLEFYSPLHIMILRFILAYATLFLLRPKRLKLSVKEEGYMILLGVFGCSVYFITENTALTYTLASNVSIIVASAPILTALLAHVATKDEKLCKNNFIGFLVAITGVALVVFNGTVVLKLNPLGDLLSLAAAACWAVYSVALRPLAARFDPLLLTRRITFWGLMTSLPMLPFDHASFSFAPLLSNGKLLLCLLFLGLLGSGLCYVAWNTAIRSLGAVATNNYIYIIPFVTLLAAALILHEPVTVMGIAGAVLIVCGIFLSPRRTKE